MTKPFYSDREGHVGKTDSSYTVTVPDLFRISAQFTKAQHELTFYDNLPFLKKITANNEKVIGN